MNDTHREIGPELPYLEAFYAVCMEGSFTDAGRILGRTQPSISYQIARLEGMVRARLFERAGRGVLLTPDGERLRQRCQDFFRGLAQLRTEWRSGVRSGSLRIGSASGFGRYVLVPALGRLDGVHGEPRLRVELRFDSAEVVLRQLERGESEAAFVYRRRITSSLRYRAVYDEELVLIAAPAFRDRLGESSVPALARLESLPFVTYDEGDYVFGRWFDITFGAQPATISSVAHFNELEEVVTFVRAGLGLSIVPRDCVRASLAQDEVVILCPGPGACCLNQVFMVQRAASSPSPELEALVEALDAESGRRGGTDRATAPRRRKMP